MDGVKCKFRDHEFEVLPLTAGLLRKGALELMRQNDELVQKNDYLAAFDVKVKLITMALQQNNPDVTEDQMADLIDFRNYLPAWSVILGGTGLGEGEAPGGTSPPSPSNTSMTPGTSNPSTDP